MGRSPWWLLGMDVRGYQEHAQDFPQVNDVLACLLMKCLLLFGKGTLMTLFIMSLFPMKNC